MKTILIPILVILITFQRVECQSDHSIAIDESLINKLESKIKQVQSKLASDMPSDIEKIIRSCKVVEDIDKLPQDSQSWIHENVSQIREAELAKYFDELSNQLSKDGNQISGEDYSLILKESFIARNQGRLFDLRNKIDDLVVYNKEISIPPFRLSPLGLGEINWIWQLNVKDRPHGVLHVGIDVSKRTFICYERNVGLYFPEGNTFDRIYSEIVQGPNVAGDYIGKGRVKKMNPSSGGSPK